MKPETMARNFMNWYPSSGRYGDYTVAFEKARSLYKLSDDVFYRTVAGIIRAEGQNRDARRKMKKPGWNKLGTPST